MHQIEMFFLLLIAATLLPGGRTAHSTFKLPLDLTSDEMPICNVGRNTAVARIMRKVRLIVWDECTMSHKRAFEAVNRMLQDIRDSKSQLWKLDEDSQLTEKAECYHSNDKWALVEVEEALCYIKNVTQNKVLTAKKDGTVTLEPWSGKRNSQLWAKNKTESEDYFHFQNLLTKNVLTSVPGSKMETKEQGCDEMFGGCLVLMTGDFRQTLPVVPGGTKADELDASIKASKLWEKVNVLKLTKNMRVHLTGDPDAKEFSETLLDIGNGELGRYTEGIVGFPEHVSVKTKKELVEATFPDLARNYKSPEFVGENAILAPRIVDVQNINRDLIEEVPEQQQIRRSYNKTINQADATKYPREVLETFNPSGVPPHILVLKEHVPIMVMRNLDPPKICNGTRLQIKKLHAHVIEAVIIAGDHKGEEFFIPRIPLIPTGLGFDFKRIQFPVQVCYAMTINKSQG